MAVAGRATRCMQEQRTHEQGITSLGCAEKLRRLGAPGLDLFLRQAAMAVRSGQHAKGAVGGIGMIQVQAQSEHLLEQGRGWLHVRNSLLHAPRTESWHLRLFSDREGEILVPRHQPIRVGGFVEVDGADRSGFPWQMGTEECQQPRRSCQSENGGIREQTTPSGAIDRAESRAPT